jgi:hypothetical protein
LEGDGLAQRAQVHLAVGYEFIIFSYLIMYDWGKVGTGISYKVVETSLGNI